MRPNHSNRRIGGKENTQSLARSLCTAVLHSAPLRAAPLTGSFVSEKVAMYARDHMRRYTQIQPIVNVRNRLVDFLEFHPFDCLPARFCLWMSTIRLLDARLGT